MLDPQGMNAVTRRLEYVHNLLGAKCCGQINIAYRNFQKRIANRATRNTCLSSGFGNHRKCPLQRRFIQPTRPRQ